VFPAVFPPADTVRSSEILGASESFGDPTTSIQPREAPPTNSPFPSGEEPRPDGVPTLANVQTICYRGAAGYPRRSRPMPKEPPIHRFHVVSAWHVYPHGFAPPDYHTPPARREPEGPTLRTSPSIEPQPIRTAGPSPAPAPVVTGAEGLSPAGPVVSSRSGLYDLPGLLNRIWTAPPMHPGSRDLRAPLASPPLPAESPPEWAESSLPPRPAEASSGPLEPRIRLSPPPPEEHARSPFMTPEAYASPLPRKSRPWICPACQLTNAPWSKFCTGCRGAAP